MDKMIEIMNHRIKTKPFTYKRMIRFSKAIPDSDDPVNEAKRITLELVDKLLKRESDDLKKVLK